MENSLPSMRRLVLRRCNTRRRLFYCLALFLICVATSFTANAQTFTNLISFNGTNGAGPTGTLIQGTDGRIYGVSGGGGAPNDAAAKGSVFKMTSSGALTTILDFCPQTPCTDGKNPEGGVVQGSDGSFYGTTYAGGASNLGTVFKVTTSGTLTVLHSFPGGAGGRSPSSQLVPGADGAFYGTTAYGGNLVACGSIGCGTIFKITSAGTLTIIHTFELTDGSGPTALLLGSDGNFYGVTGGGGTLSDGGEAEGTVFQMTPAGALTTLHSFAGYTSGDGSAPSGLTQGTDGNLYGATSKGGLDKAGIIFKVTSSGQLTILYSFTFIDGSGPSGLVQGDDGNFYGTTIGGGLLDCPANSYCGTIFQITPSGTLTTLHSFDGTDGSTPYSGVMQATNGIFYGTTTQDYYGATCERDSVDCGTLFSLSMGFPPFVTPRPSSGAVGQKITILGTNLTGTTAVSFNGTRATFTANGSAIITTVPAGATSGTITVTTPSGTLSSNVAFRVSP